MTTELTALKTEHDHTKKLGEENLKYLINLDRNTQRHNVMIFGLPENDDLIVGNDGDETAKRATNEMEKVSTVLSHLNSDISNITHFHRMGKPGERSRPVKVVFKSANLASKALSNSKSLNDWEKSVYVKPYKSKSKYEEFKRIGKRKTDLLLQHPTVDPKAYCNTRKRNS